ncbi:hypothetical protein X735_31495 [Mesorhizobium sp. L2C085B000]|nr:hypothetical protein X735_31495 [Mesorhizobium sp. L2C085B000]
MTSESNSAGFIDALAADIIDSAAEIDGKRVGYWRPVQFWRSERRPQPVAEFAIDLRRPDLHERMRTVKRPPDLLLLDPTFPDSPPTRREWWRREAQPGSAFHS